MCEIRKFGDVTSVVKFCEIDGEALEYFQKMLEEQDTQAEKLEAMEP